jgi:hypothetical protein
MQVQSPLSKTRWPFLAAGLVLAAVAAVVCLTFQNYGISWDEQVQNTYGQLLLRFYASGFHDRSAMTYLNLFYYGGFFDILAAIANLVSPFGVYETRHLLGGVFMLVGLAGAWRLTRLLAGPRAAFFAVTLLVLTPLMYGHSFINPKDAPLAWLSLWVLYYAARAVAEGAPRLLTVAGFAVTVGLAMGTRLMAAQLLVYILAALLMGLVVERLRPRSPSTPPSISSPSISSPSMFSQSVPLSRTILGLLMAAPLAYLIMGMFWPWSVLSPLNPVLALKEFTNFPWKGWLLWRGEMVPATHLPRDYLASLLLYQLSEHTLAGLVLACGAGVAAAVRKQVFADRRTLQYAMLIQAAVVPLVMFIILRPTVYNGMRHFLFVVPPLVIMAAIGWDRLFAGMAARWRGYRVAAGGVLAALLLWAAARMVQLHPYEYVAYNSIVGGVPGAAGAFELDYWDTSLAEASRQLAAYMAKAGHTAPPAVFVCGNRLSAAAFLPKDIRFVYDVEKADYFITIAPSACRDHVDVTRHRIAEVRRDHVTLSYVIDLRAARAEAHSPGSL